MIVVVLIGALWLYIMDRPNEKDPNLAIFSWDQATVLAEGEGTHDFLNHYQIKRLFQSFSSDLSITDIQLFREDIGSEIAVYQLIGTPEWAREDSVDSLLDQAARVVAINQQLPTSQRLQGLVVDVEPYLLDDFDWEDETLQLSFMTNMKKLYAYLMTYDLEMITVVPYFYDTKGYTEVLTFLMREAATELAIMNYYREDEVDHMQYEADIAKTIGLPITTIYEFKPPGMYGLTERNTYYGEGLEAALMNFNAITDAFSDQDIYGAFHDLTALKEVVGYE